MNNSISPELIFMVSSSSDYACIIDENYRYVAMSQPYSNIQKQVNLKSIVDGAPSKRKNFLIVDDNGNNIKLNITHCIFRDDSDSICGRLFFAKKIDSQSFSLTRAHELDKEREQYREALLHDADYS